MNSSIIRRIAVAASLLVLVGPAAGSVLAGDGYRIIKTDELKKKLKSAAPPTLVFSLSHMEYDEQRIPGSICIPMEMMTTSADMPADKAQPLVFYCKGPG